MEKIILDIFMKTHHHMLEEKLNHWQYPALTTLPWICFSFFGLEGLNSQQANYKSQQFLHYNACYLSVLPSQLAPL